MALIENINSQALNLIGLLGFKLISDGEELLTATLPCITLELPTARAEMFTLQSTFAAARMG
jgi:hypothetical protein